MRVLSAEAHGFARDCRAEYRAIDREPRNSGMKRKMAGRSPAIFNASSLFQLPAGALRTISLRMLSHSSILTP
jgi:hypothetical protein